MTTLTGVLCVLAGVIAAITAGVAIKRWPWFALWWYGTWAIICTALAAINLVLGRWNGAAFMVACAFLYAWLWWRHWNRRKRKGAFALFGAKSRARIAVLVTRQRETAQPRPARPLPQGTP